jgi:tetratricopeptide (TPR) repeat protein
MTTRLIVLAGCAALAAACGPSGDNAAADFVARGDAQAASGRLEAAAIEYRNAIKHAPEWAAAHRKLGDAQKDLGNANGAFRAYREACRLEPADHATCVESARLLLASDFAEEAQRIAAEVVARAPRDVEAHLVLARATARIGRLSEAINVVGQALAIEPGPAGYGVVAEIREAQGEPEDAEEALRTAVEKWPASPEAHVNLARYLSEDGRDDEAEAHLLEAVRLAPDDERSNRSLAALYIELGLPDEAEPYLKRAAAQPNQKYNSMMALVDFYAGEGRWTEARDVLDHAPREGVVAKEARVRLAALQYETGQYETAHRTLEPILKQKPSAQAWTLHAQFLAREGRFDAALKSARKAVALQPDLSAAHLVIAAVERELGNQSAADEALQAAGRGN